MTEEFVNAKLYGAATAVDDGMMSGLFLLTNGGFVGARFRAADLEKIQQFGAAIKVYDDARRNVVCVKIRRWGKQ